MAYMARQVFIVLSCASYHRCLASVVPPSEGNKDAFSDAVVGDQLSWAMSFWERRTLVLLVEWESRR